MSVHSWVSRPLRVTDFGGGAPTIPWMAGRLGLDLFKIYRIVEQEAFVRRVPNAWNQLAAYASEFGNEPVDIVVISSVLPYIDRALETEWFDRLQAMLPRFIYLGRTAFLPELYPEDEVYTIQESRFKDHGPQIPTGLDEIERQIARYPRRHLKLSSIEIQLTSMGYRRKVALIDDSGVEHNDDLKLYADNALWERSP